MTDGTEEIRVRPLDERGRPIIAPVEPPDRSRLLVGGVLAAVVVLAIGAVVAWRALIGSPFSAAEDVPADADLVVTMDFLQVRDVDRVDRFVRAFAEPMQRHGVIDDVPDLEAALREFDDLTESEIGFRFAEDVLSWIGRSGSLAVWVPESAFSLDTFAPSAPPAILATIDVRDQDAATDFVDRIIGELEADGTVVERIQVAGNVAYHINDGEAMVLALVDGRLILGDSTGTVRRAIELDPSDSVAQRDDFQQLASAIGGDPVMTFFAAASLGEKASVAYGALGLDMPFSDQLGSATMAAVTLDDDGIAVRTANRTLEGLSAEPGEWAAGLPADTYGFFDVVLPERYLAEMTNLYIDSLAETGLTEQDIAGLTAPADEILGMSLLDDVLPQFGGEVLFAVMPATDSLLVRSAGFDIGLLFGIGVDDAAVVSQAVDRALSVLAEAGVEAQRRGEVQVISVDGSIAGAVAVTDDAFFATSSPDTLEALLEGRSGLASSERYRRVDDLIAGDGLAAYLDIAGLVEDFATDEVVGDVLAPLVAMGAGYTVEGELQITEMRLLVDY
jgi:hypothetical protein